MPPQEHDVATLEDLPVGGMRQVQVNGENILLTREADAAYAVGATCPHAGGPLAEGVRHAGRITCPWHKARFCLRTGTLLDPPAVDPLPRYGVRIEGTRVLVTLPAMHPAETTATADHRCFAIVGAGAAGAVAAQTLRETGFGGRIVMVDRDNRVPYDRTILSKYFISGEKGGEKSPLQTQEFYRRHRIERRTAEVVQIDAVARRITCADGSVLHYDAALLATGSVPQRPSIRGVTLNNVFLLRSRADADAILAQAERSERAVVLGASFIGMEIAASLRERGLDVTVVGKEKVPFEKQLGAEVGAAFLGLHKRRGVLFRLGTGIAAFEGAPDLRCAVLENGARVPADLAVLGVGAVPATNYLSGLPRNEDGSVTVDPNLRIVNALYAAGDVACFPSRGDGAPIRVEHWRVAEQQGRLAALNMAGQALRYEAVPVFWTIQYLKRLDYIGHAKEWDEIVLHGDPAKPEFLAYYVKDGRVVAAAGLDRDRDTAALIELFSMRRDWTAEALGGWSGGFARVDRSGVTRR